MRTSPKPEGENLVDPPHVLVVVIAVASIVTLSLCASAEGAEKIKLLVGPSVNAAMRADSNCCVSICYAKGQMHRLLGA